MSRGRPAARPGASAQRPQVLDPAGLVVTHLDEDGHRRVDYDFAVLPLRPAMARSVAERFAQFAGPGGTWRSVNSSRLGVRHAAPVRPVLGRAAAATGGPARHHAGDVAMWRLATGERQGRLLKFTAGFLRGHPRLPQATRDLIMRRLPAETVTETTYTTQEFDAIKRD